MSAPLNPLHPSFFPPVARAASVATVVPAQEARGVPLHTRFLSATPVAEVSTAAAGTVVAVTLSPACPPSTSSSHLEAGKVVVVTVTRRPRFKEGAAVEVMALMEAWATVAEAEVRLRSAQSVGSQSAAAYRQTAQVAARAAVAAAAVEFFFTVTR